MVAYLRDGSWEEAARLLSESKGVPKATAEKLCWRMAKRKGDEVVIEGMNEEIMRNPTWDEFNTLLNGLDDGSAGGISGLSYGMMREWD